MIFVKFIQDQTPAVIGGALVEMDTNEYKTFNNISEAFELITQYKKVYFFDGLKSATFLMYYLFENGFSYSQNKKRKSFFAKISAGNQFYYLRIYDEKMKKTEFFDAIHIIPISELELIKTAKIPLPDLKAQCLYIASLIKSRPENKAITLSAYIKDDVFNYIDKSVFYSHFPILSRSSKDALRLAYKGGVCWLDPKYKNKTVFNVLELDVNHLYPYICAEYLLPYSVPYYSKGKFTPSKTWPLGIQFFSCAYELKKNGIAFLNVDAFFSDFNIKAKETSNNKIITLAMPFDELQLFLKNYNVYCFEYIEYYAFRGKRGVLKNYIKHFNEIKEASEGIEREIAKRRNNLLTGLFGELDRMTIKTPYLKDGLIKYHYKVLTKFNASGYLPAAIFITSYGRIFTVSLAEKHRDNYIYSDTDSCYFHGLSESVFADIIESATMGKWKLKKWDRVIFMQEKQYIAFNQNEQKQVIAGLPKSYILNESEFYKGAQIAIKTPARVKGGYILKDSVFTIGT